MKGHHIEHPAFYDDELFCNDKFCLFNTVFFTVAAAVVSLAVAVVVVYIIFHCSRVVL